MQQFDQGDRPTWPVTLTTAAGGSFTPTAVTVKIQRPSGSTSTYTEADTSVVAIASNVVTVTCPVLNESGVWRIKLWSTAPNAAAAEVAFACAPTSFTNP